MKTFLSAVGIIVLIILGMITGSYIHDYLDENPDLQEKLGFKDKDDDKKDEDKEEDLKDIITTNGEVTFQVEVSSEDTESDNKYFKDKEVGETAEITLSGYVYDSGYEIEVENDQDQIDDDDPVGALVSYYSSLSVKDIEWFKSMLKEEDIKDFDYDKWNEYLTEYDKTRMIKVKAVGIDENEVILMTEVSTKAAVKKLVYHYMKRHKGAWIVINSLENEDLEEILERCLTLGSEILYSKDES